MASIFSSATIASILSDIATAIGIAKVIDPSIGNSPIVSEAENIIGSGATDLANYAAGQAVVVAPLSVQGAAGVLLAVKSGGAAAQSLGL